MNKKTGYILYSFFIVFSIFFVCLIMQEMQIKILSRLSLLVSFIGGMFYMAIVIKKTEHRRNK